MRARRASARFLAWLACFAARGGSDSHAPAITTVSSVATAQAVETAHTAGLEADAMRGCYGSGLNVSLVGAHFDVLSVPWYPLTVQRNGSFVGVYDMLLATVARSAGFTYAQRPPRNGTTFADAIDEVARGGADLAWGAFEHSATRGASVDLPVVLKSSGLRVLARRVPRHERELTIDMVLLIFAPFSNSLWAILGGMVVATAVVMCVRERRAGGRARARAALDSRSRRLLSSRR